jgi:hypothetical protein
MASTTVATTQNNQKGTLGNPPTPFDGTPEKLDTFLFELGHYLALNDTLFPSDKKKILFAFTFLKGGSAGAWKEDWSKDHETDLKDDKIKMDDFVKSLEDAFKVYNKPAEAFLHLQGAQKTKDQSIYRFIETFKQWKRDSQITDEMVLMNYFYQALPPQLRKKIMTSDSPPDTLEKAFEAAKRYEHQDKQFNAWDNIFRATHKADNRPKFFPTPRHSTDPNAMQVDQIPIKADRLSPEQVEEYRRNGLCFKCGQKGHRSSDHRTFRNQNPPTFTKPPTFQKTNAKDAYNRIRAIMQELPEEERDAFYKEAANSDF